VFVKDVRSITKKVTNILPKDSCVAFTENGIFGYTQKVQVQSLVGGVRCPGFSMKANKFNNVLELFDEDRSEVLMNFENSFVSIGCGEYSATIPCQSWEPLGTSETPTRSYHYQSMQKFRDTYKLPYSHTGDDPVRDVLRNVLVHEDAFSTKISATDGHRMFQSRIIQENPEISRWQLPREILDYAFSLKKNELHGEVKLNVYGGDPGYVEMIHGSIKMLVKMTSREGYPQVDQLIPRQFARILNINAKSFKVLLDNYDKKDKYPVWKFCFTADNTVEVQHKVKDEFKPLASAFCVSQVPFEIGLDPRKLVEFVLACDPNKAIEIKLNTPTSPMVLSQGESMLLVMPIQLRT
jgi:hypothetical protein